MRSLRAKSVKSGVGPGVLAALFIGVALTMQVLPVHAVTPERRAAFCPEGDVVAASKLPPEVSSQECDLVGKVVTHGSLSVEVPSPGNGVAASALGEAGESSLEIFTSHSGVVSIVESRASADQMLVGEAAPPPCDEQAIDGCLAPCQDNNFHLGQYQQRVKKSQPWFFKGSSTPLDGTPALTKSKALDHIKAGTQAILQGRNDCNLDDPVSQTAPFKGGTTKSAGMTATSTSVICSSFDGTNVVDFGVLPTAYLGLACSTYYSTGGPYFIREADIRLRKSAPWTTAPDVSGCFNLFDLQGVMAHERGHAFGLSHTDAVATHIPQTMYPSSYPCNSYQRTLGKGDIRGLRELY